MDFSKIKVCFFSNYYSSFFSRKIYTLFKDKISTYQNLKEFINDVNLVFVNCITYNSPTHSITQDAAKISRKFEKSLRTHFGGGSKEILLEKSDKKRERTQG